MRKNKSHVKSIESTKEAKFQADRIKYLRKY